MNNVQCLNCQHFRMWEGDPCCLEPDKGWKVILPDMTRDCELYEVINEPSVYGEDIWKKCWENEREEFFETVRLTDPIYSQYIEEHPEYKELIEKAE